MTKKTRRRYTAAFKAAAVARLDEPGESLSSVPRHSAWFCCKVCSDWLIG
jgi:transposase-like protein